MIRKQIYLAPEQDQKVKALAAAHGCSEAAVIREALDHLALPRGTVADRLASAGLLADESYRPAGIDVNRLQDLEDELEHLLATRSGPLFLSEAVLSERGER